MLKQMQANLCVTDAMLEKGVMHTGSWTRLANAMRRAAVGEPITIAGFGGSITQGAVSGTPENCYFAHVASWWKETFPNCEVTVVNAGIGATNSCYGIHRIEGDVLQHHPDVVVMDYSVNDRGGELELRKTYEACTRRILADPKAALILYSFAVQDGSTDENLHHDIACHYDLPQLSYKQAFYAADFWETQCKDGTHPEPDGHGRAGLQLRVLCAEVYDALDAQPQEVPALPEPLDPESVTFDDACIVDLAAEAGFTVQPGCFVKNEEIVYTQKHDYFGYTAQTVGEPMKITIPNANRVRLMMVFGPNEGEVEVTANGTCIRKGKMYADWGKYMFVTGKALAKDGSVEMTVQPLKAPVTLLALLLS